jgi:hypothetical protein
MSKKTFIPDEQTKKSAKRIMENLEDDEENCEDKEKDECEYER